MHRSIWAEETWSRREAHHGAAGCPAALFSCQALRMSRSARVISGERVSMTLWGASISDRFSIEVLGRVRRLVQHPYSSGGFASTLYREQFTSSFFCSCGTTIKPTSPECQESHPSPPFPRELKEVPFEADSGRPRPDRRNPLRQTHDTGLRAGPPGCLLSTIRVSSGPRRSTGNSLA
jgi:hypothetical protein